MKKSFLTLFFFLLFCGVSFGTMVSPTHTVSYTCLGTTGPFSFTFPIYTSTDLTVTESSIGVLTGYTVTPVNNDYMNGGSVTLANACTSGDTLTITRSTTITQEQQYINGMPALYSTFEASLDKLTMILQDQITTPMALFPSPQAGKLIGWDALGQYLVNTSQSSTTMGTALVYYLSNYASLSAALTTIGSIPATLYIDTAGTIGTNTTTPSTLSIAVIKGGGIVLTGNLVVSGAFSAGLYPVFSGAGTVTFSNIDRVEPEWWGATGSGSPTDDQAAFQLAANSVMNTDEILHCTAGRTYYIGSQLNLRYVCGLDLQCKIVSGVAAGSPSVIIGDTQTQGYTNKKYIASVRTAAGTVPSDPLIRIIGTKNNNLHIGSCEYVQMYADVTTADNSSGYNQPLLDYVKKFETVTDGSASTWINENVIYGGRLQYLTNTNGSSNHYIYPVLENSTVYINGQNNDVLGARFEGTSTVIFDIASYANLITQAYVPNYSRPLTITPFVTDNGMANIITNSRVAYMERKPILTISSRTLSIFNASADRAITNIDAGLENLKIVSSSGSVFNDNSKIPVVSGPWLQFKSDSASWRTTVYVYDVNGNPITTTDPLLIGAQKAYTNLTWNASGYYNVGSNISNFVMHITNSSIGFIKFSLSAGNSTASTWFKYASFEGWYPKKEAMIANTYFSENGKRTTPATAASPTTGFATVGQMVTKTDFSALYGCKFSLDTTLAANLIAGSKSANVTSAANVVNGDIVGIQLDDGSTQWTSVGANVNPITLAANATSQATLGNRIVFVRWATRILRDYLVKGFVINQYKLEDSTERLEGLHETMALLESKKYRGKVKGKLTLKLSKDMEEI